MKSSGGKRESDGVVVPLIAVSNAAGGKGPDFGHVGRGGKREGMARTAEPNYPEGRHVAPAKVRQLQNRLWAAAKQSPGRRFHALVVLCSSRTEAEQAQQLAIALLGELGLVLHPEKTRVVDLRGGKEGFDFLGCHFRARMSGTLWERRRIVRYYLHRWPSVRSMKRARARIKALTDRSQVGQQLEDVIRRLNQFLNLRAGQAARWTRTWFHDQGLHKLMGTIRYPKAA